MNNSPNLVPDLNVNGNGPWAAHWDEYHCEFRGCRDHPVAFLWLERREDTTNDVYVCQKYFAIIKLRQAEDIQRVGLRSEFEMASPESRGSSSARLTNSTIIGIKYDTDKEPTQSCST